MKKNKNKVNMNSSKQNVAHPSFMYQNHSLADCKDCDFDCENCNLSKKNICIVGGVERMEALYRSYIEKNGGSLDYHSGSMQSGIGKLEKFLQRADMIICPINCNSHTACLKVKDIARKFGKEFHMLPTGSLSAVKRLLHQYYA